MTVDWRWKCLDCKTRLIVGIPRNYLLTNCIYYNAFSLVVASLWKTIRNNILTREMNLMTKAFKIMQIEIIMMVRNTKTSNEFRVKKFN